MSSLTSRSRRSRLALATFTVVSLALAGCASTGSATNAPPSTATVVVPEADGPGVTADTITVSWGQAAFPSIEDASIVELKNQATTALVDAFNAGGGIAGRKVEIIDEDPGTPLMAARSTTVTSSGGLAVPDASNGQDMCDAYKDSGVFALLFNPLATAPYGTPAAGRCLNAQGQVLVGGTEWALSDYTAAPATAGLSLATDRFFDALIAAGEDSKFFEPGGTTALITDPTDTSGFVDSVYLPALAAAGVEDPLALPLSPAATPAEALSTVVKLKAEGVDQVVFASKASFTAAFYLLPVMQEQGYMPRILSLDGADWTLIPLLGTITVDDNLTSSLVTYASKPAGDIATLTEEQLATPAGALYAQVVEDNPTLNGFVSLDLADALQLLKATLESSGSDHVNAEAFTTGLRNLSGYSSPRLLATQFGPDRQDGSSGIVLTTFSPDCNCAVFAEDVVTF